MIRHSSRFSLFVCLVLFVALPALAAGDSRGPGDRDFGRDLFAEAAQAQAQAAIGGERATDPTQIRSRLVNVNFAELARQERAIALSPADRSDFFLNLFADTSFTARLDRVERNLEGSVTFLGALVDQADSSVILTVMDDVLIGSVTRGTDTYVIRYAGDGLHEIAQTDHRRFAECLYPEIENPLPEEPSRPSVVGTESRPGEVASDADSGATLDVMVVYTPTTRSAAGGTTAINATITQAVAETNTGYGNSQVNPRIRLVHTAEVSYSESGFNWTRTMTRLVKTNDGYIDNVHTLRNTYQADMVVMIVENGQYCGLANAIMATASGAF
ncbi:MAG TPA: hypothetical protein VFO89_13385, partial [Thermoanaerobaculia bacterium]|nr:hypothetical protein [Thermoanaerobaculia bacterium]